MQKGRLSVDVHDILVIELEPGHGIAGFQMLRLFCWRPIHSIRLWQCAKACGFLGHWYTQKGFRVENGMVHMAFGGKVDHGVVPIGIEGMLHNLCIADVAITKICRGLPDSEATFSGLAE